MQITLSWAGNDEVGLLSCRNLKRGKQTNRFGVNKQQRALPSAGPLCDREVSQHRSNDSLSDKKKTHTKTHPWTDPFAITKFIQFGASEIFTLPRSIFTWPQARVLRGLKRKKKHLSLKRRKWLLNGIKVQM